MTVMPGWSNDFMSKKCVFYASNYHKLVSIRNVLSLVVIIIFL